MSRLLRQSALLTGAAALALLVAVAVLWAYVINDHRQAAAGGEPLSTSLSSTSPAPEPEPTWTIDDAREVFTADGSRVLVLGDSTGNGNDEWVHLWAQARQLPVAAWDTDGEAGYPGESEDTRVWSGAMFSASADYPLAHEEIWPEQEPDLVLLNYGHFQSSGKSATTQMEELRAEIAERLPEAPIVVVLQNPEQDDADAEIREAIATWAKGAGLPTIDVAKAFADSGKAPSELLADEVNPSPEGSQLWAETVGEALG